MAVTQGYYSEARFARIPAFIHRERCWPEVDKYSPCEASCPLNMDIPNYIMAIARGDPRKALEIIRETNPLPSVCGRVCHHPCEAECNRKVVDMPIAIATLKQFAADCIEEEKPEAIPVTKAEKVAVIGSGPAGLTAAHDLVRKGYQVTVFEAAPVAGGILTSAIPDFILSREAVEKDINYIKALGVQIHTGISIGRDVSFETIQRRGYGAILLAIGNQKSVNLRIPGVDLPGIVTALDYLKEAKRGFLPPFTGKVWVIGGGAVAMDCARTALRHSAQEVHVACLESREQMPAFTWEIEAAEREGIHIHAALAPQAFVNRNGSQVSGVKFKRVTSTSLDSNGRISWTLAEGTGSEFEIDTDEIIVAIGQAMEPDGLPDININHRGVININTDTGETGVTGLFAAGDAAGNGRTVTDSMAAGRKAAYAIDQYLSGKPVSIPKDNRGVIYIKSEQVPSYFVSRDRWEMPKLSARQAIKTNKEVNLGYAYWQAVEEANRCLNCRMCANCIFERGQLCYETASRLL